MMKIAKLFTNGHSQAVRLPKDCRFARGEKEVYVHKVEDIVMLIPKKNPWNAFLRSLDKFTDDFMVARERPLSKDSREDL